MSLYDDASLIMFPSGYKENKIYSLKPTDGSGDLTFTRASTATRVNADGLIETSPVNLLQYSEDFNNAFYTKVEVTVNSNTTTAPNGTTTADSLLDTTTNFIHALTPLTSKAEEPTTFTFSVYAKFKDANRKIALSFDDAISGGCGSGVFNLLTGVFDSAIEVPGAGFTNPIRSAENVGNGWYRLIFTITSNSVSGIRSNIFVADNSNNQFYAGNGTGIFIWGAQLNIGSTAKPYFPTTDRLNVPRIDYTGGGCGSLLLEPQRTNLVTYSEQFDNADWSKLGQGIADTAVVTANYAISPDGTQNATRFVCNLNGGTTSNDRSWMIASFTAQATSTISIWIKLNSAGTKTFVFSDAGGGTKTISGTDWQRIDETFLSPGGEFRIGLIGGTGSSDTLDCCIWGAQAESGSYKTSYIPTTTTAVTRLADSASKTGISSLIGQTQGTMFVEVELTSASEQILIITSAAGNEVNRLQIYIDASRKIGLYRGDASVSILSSSAYSLNSVLKIAAVYKSNDYALYINGVSVGTDTSATIPPTPSVLYLGSYVDGSKSNSVTVNQAALFKTRLSNEQLATLTTL